MSLFHYFLENQQLILNLSLQHMFLVAVGALSAALVGIPAGVLMTRKPSLKKPILALANVIQTIPSLALFGFLIPILGASGIGPIPAMIALFLYSLLPIIRNTFAGITGIDPAIREAAVGLGMTDWQILYRIELPLAVPVILAGIRVAVVISIGTATIAAAIGAGGLGTLIFRGLRTNDNLLILAGAIPAALMAILADALLGWFERGKLRTIGIALLLGAAAFALYGIPHLKPKPQVVVGSKDFTEQVILSEILSQLVEKKTGLRVERKFELGGDLCHRALVSGDIDGYVEYTGTAYTAILKHPPIADPQKVYQTVKQEYASRFHAEWLLPLGFNDTFAILVRKKDAEKLHLKTISDAALYAPKWRAAFGQDFMARADGYPGFARVYQLHFQDPPKEMDLSLTYRALADGKVDLIAGNSTDGLIKKLHLVELVDDRHYFPPYFAGPVFRKETLEHYPLLQSAVNALAGKISNEEMRRLNFEVDEMHHSAKNVASEFLSQLK